MYIWTVGTLTIVFNVNGILNHISHPINLQHVIVLTGIQHLKFAWHKRLNCHHLHSLIASLGYDRLWF